MRKLGFSLTELLVVIGIVLILMALIFPVFSRARAAAKTSAMVQQQRQITLALQLYSEDYGGKQIWSGSMPQPDWPSLLHPYVKSEQILKNPDYIGRPKYVTNLGEGFALNTCVMAKDFIETENPILLIEAAPYKLGENWVSNKVTSNFDVHEAILYPGAMPIGGKWLATHRNGGSIVSYWAGNTKWLRVSDLPFRGNLCTLKQNIPVLFETKIDIE